MPIDGVLPLVSAIMPTRGRQQWAAEAVRMFTAQTYPHKELVIIDDLQEPSFQRCPDGARYWLRVPRYPIGAKRNLAVSESFGAVICHWDSDDTYAPDRIERQVEQLLQSDVDLVGYHTLEFVEADGQYRRFMFESDDPSFCAGVSMMYWREAWEAKPFSQENTGEDLTFWMNHPRRKGFDSEGRIVARIHAGNTADKRDPKYLQPPAWRQIA